MRLPFATAMLVPLLACADLPRTSSQVQAGGLRMVLEHTEFDGTTLRGRVLVGAVTRAQTLEVKSLLIGGVFVSDVVECGSGRKLQLWSRDGGWGGQLGPTEVVVSSESWYGRDFSVTPVREELTCALMTLVVPVRSAECQNGLRLRVRARQGGRVDILGEPTEGESP